MLGSELGGLRVHRHAEPKHTIRIPKGHAHCVAQLLLGAEGVKDWLLHKQHDGLHYGVLPYSAGATLVIVCHHCVSISSIHTINSDSPGTFRQSITADICHGICC